MSGVGFEAETLAWLVRASAPATAPVTARGAPPRVRALHLPPGRSDDDLAGESCAQELEDGSLGLSCVLFGHTLPTLRSGGRAGIVAVLAWTAFSAAASPSSEACPGPAMKLQALAPGLWLVPAEPEDADEHRRGQVPAFDPAWRWVGEQGGALPAGAAVAQLRYWQLLLQAVEQSLDRGEAGRGVPPPIAGQERETADPSHALNGQRACLRVEAALLQRSLR